MNICIIGTGYVGLVTGTCFAEFGNHVICVDSDESKLQRLRAGQMPIYEPGLDSLCAKNVRAGRLEFTSDITDAIERSLVVLIAVGTPSSEDGSVDMSQVHAVARQIAGALNSYKVIVTKSTVPVGTAQQVRKIINENKTSNCRFSVASNPEFLREGAAINDFLHPDRVVIGCREEEAIAILRDLYRPIYLIETPIVVTTPESAELIKYAANAFLATKISFINEIANLCDLVGADVHVVAKSMGMDKRIGPKFLHPGPGFGGSCFPKDVKGLCNLARQAGGRMRLVEAVVDVNSKQTELALSKVQRLLPDVTKKTVAVLGLAFKPETDDMREAPAVKIIEKLLANGASVRAYDPAAMDVARAMMPTVTYCTDEYEAALGADCLVVVTEWNQFRSINFEKLKGVMRERNLADLRNIYDPKTVREAGFTYVSIGRDLAASSEIFARTATKGN
jgi:UDPglucose 6-dehydrogenase